VRVPRHVAIIMDGNGRWAERRGLPRTAGHRAGLEPVRMAVEECGRRGVTALTLFAFSSENFRRPVSEVGLLMQIFLEALDREIDELAAKGVAVRFIGARDRLGAALVERMVAAEERTRGNAGLRLAVAVAYGGRWDIVAAAQRLACAAAAGELEPAAIDEQRFAAELALGDLPEPDLFIRSGGDQRISNFLLWNLAYTELWFTETLWPDFDAAELERAIADFAERERRFGMSPVQLGAGAC
jgi:undecaprenyl diphosphate synthase